MPMYTIHNLLTNHSNTFLLKHVSIDEGISVEADAQYDECNDALGQQHIERQELINAVKKAD